MKIIEILNINEYMSQLMLKVIQNSKQSFILSIIYFQCFFITRFVIFLLINLFLVFFLNQAFKFKVLNPFREACIPFTLCYDVLLGL